MVVKSYTIHNATGRRIMPLAGNPTCVLAPGESLTMGLDELAVSRLGRVPGVSVKLAPPVKVTDAVKPKE